MLVTMLLQQLLTTRRSMYIRRSNTKTLSNTNTNSQLTVANNKVRTTHTKQALSSIESQRDEEATKRSQPSTKTNSLLLCWAEIKSKNLNVRGASYTYYDGRAIDTAYYYNYVKLWLYIATNAIYTYTYTYTISYTYTQLYT